MYVCMYVCIEVQEKEKKVVLLCCVDGNEKIQESVPHVQSCCFANLMLLLL